MIEYYLYCQSSPLKEPCYLFRVKDKRASVAASWSRNWNALASAKDMAHQVCSTIQREHVLEPCKKLHVAESFTGFCDKVYKNIAWSKPDWNFGFADHNVDSIIYSLVTLAKEELELGEDYFADRVAQFYADGGGKDDSLTV